MNSERLTSKDKQGNIVFTCCEDNFKNPLSIIDIAYYSATNDYPISTKNNAKATLKVIAERLYKYENMAETFK